MLFERDVVEPENVRIFTENVDIFVALVILAIVTTVSGFGIIKELGSVSNKVLVMLRNALLIYPAVQLYDDVVTPIQIVGYGVTAVGTTAFAFIKVSQEVIVRTKSQMDLAALLAEEEARETGTGGRARARRRAAIWTVAVYGGRNIGEAPSRGRRRRRRRGSPSLENVIFERRRAMYRA